MKLYVMQNGIMTMPKATLCNKTGNPVNLQDPEIYKDMIKAPIPSLCRTHHSRFRSF